MLYFNKRLFVSDIHFFQKNINIFEYDKRKCLTDKDIAFFDQQTNPEIIEELKLIDKRMMDFILNSINSETREVQEVVFVGDFFFNFNQHKYETLDYDFNTIKEFMDNIPYRKVLVLWNHDDLKYIEQENKEHLYNKLFDEVILMEQFVNEDTNVLVTHYPIGFSENFTPKAKDQSYKIFLELDKKIVELYLKNRDNKKIINIHGHIHSNPLEHKVDGVEYINVSIENFLD